MKVEERIELLRLAHDLGLKTRDLSQMFNINEAQVRNWLDQANDEQPTLRQGDVY